MNRSIFAFITSGILGMFLPIAGIAQDDVEIKTTPLSGSVHMLVGKGGNVGVLSGEDGTFMIDDQFAPLTEKLLSAIKAIGGDTPKYVINTHFHGDHTGGNENLGNMDATIVAHENVRKRLAEGGRIAAFDMNMAPYTKQALPSITFSKDATFHLNGETINVFHIANAHTDGDGIVHFMESNVVHAGDTFFNGFYPFIDVPNGGSVKGVIAAAEAILARSNDETKIIPGHGPLATKADLQSYHDMLVLVQGRVSEMKSNGKTVDEVVAADPLADIEAQWGNGIFPGAKWLTLIYDGV